MRGLKIVGVGLVLLILSRPLWVGAHQGDMEMRVRRTGSGSFSAALAKGDTIWYSGFEPGDPLGVNVDYNAKASPDMWHVTDRMRYEGTTTWMTAPAGSYFCHIGDDSTGYSDGDEVGYQIQMDLTNYGDVTFYYLSAMQAYDVDSDFDKFVVWGTYEGLGDTWINLDPGPGYSWGGDWGTSWYEPDDGVILLDDFAGHAGVIIEFWFLSETGHADGFGVAIDEILISGTPATAVEGMGLGSALPQAFDLNDPYPNPFNASASIRYRIPDVEIQLAIYNVRGQLIRILAQGFVGAGDHIATWNGRDERGQDVQSGIYFCQLRSGELSLTRKLVLLR